jgi:hypothetical protein
VSIIEARQARGKWPRPTEAPSENADAHTAQGRAPDRPDDRKECPDLGLVLADGMEGATPAAPCQIEDATLETG